MLWKHVGHMSRGQNNVPWIPGKIVTCLHVNNFSVAQISKKLNMQPLLPFRIRKTCVTRVGHVSRGRDHIHWIPGKILTCLHVNNFSVAQKSKKLDMQPLLPLGIRKTYATRVGHVSRGRDHVHWIPGEILTCLHVKNFSVAQPEPELGLTPTKKRRGALEKKRRGFEKN